MVESLRVRCLFLLSVAVLAGCGGSKVDPNRPKVVPVQGIVTYEAKPLADATIVFRSTTAGMPGATGLTNADGEFELQTFVPRDGAIPGAYEVLVSKYENRSSKVEDDGASDSASGDAPEPKTLIPLRYQNGKKSGLTADVVDGNENRFKFDLKK